MNLTIVGRGRVGRGLHRALRATGVDARLTAGRSPRVTSRHPLILAVPDPHVAAVAQSLAEQGHTPPAVLHCSGSLPTEPLASLAASGSAVGVMHPLISFADPRRPPRLSGATFVFDGQRRALDVARLVAGALDARVVRASIHGPAYHAAAALSANGAVGLAAIAVGVMERLGLTKREAERALGALLRTVGENIEQIGLPGALSGPIVRGDAGTVRKHRRALAGLDTNARKAYDAVGPSILSCARQTGLDDAAASRVRRALRSQIGKK